MLNSKVFLSTVIIGTLLAFPVLANEQGVDVSENVSTENFDVSNTDSSTEIANTLQKFNKTVASAYEKNQITLDRSLIKDDLLYQQLEARNNYILSTQSSYSIVDGKEDFKIDKIYPISDDMVKVLTTRTIDQKLYEKETGEFPFYSSTQEGFILEKIDNSWKISRVIDGIYGKNPKLEEFINSFDTADERMMLFSLNSSSSNLTAEKNDIIKDLSGVDYLNLADPDVIPLDSVRTMLSEPVLLRSYMYSKANACAYALKWGGSARNPAFGDYSYSGGDCANFTSQCLNGGGMTFTDAWTPHSYQFINVNGQRDMLINTGRAKGFFRALPVYPRNLDTTGTVLHYTDGNTWYHAVIITKDPRTGYNNIRVTGHTANDINGGIMPINNIRSFQVM